MEKRKSSWLIWGLTLSTAVVLCSGGADLLIRIPGDLSAKDGYYRLDYRPPVGSPAANTTFKDISDTINFTDGLPGFKYDFWLYYTNASITDWLTWTASVTTAPDHPNNLSINVLSGEVAELRWEPPILGRHSGYNLKVIPLTQIEKPTRNIETRETFSQLRDLTPGATYEIRLYTVYENKESQAYISTNFTTKPNTPGRFIVWFRNETTLLVLWQPPYPAGFYTDYKVSIEPKDASISEIYVPKIGDPPGPAQAAFNGLVPGRSYNVSVETLSEGQTSDTRTAQYKTVPLRPLNVTFDSVGPNFFSVKWMEPIGLSEFDKYQVTLILPGNNTSQIILKGQPLVVTFTENIRPGMMYAVEVKAMSGSVESWPAEGNVTTRPLPVKNLMTYINHTTGGTKLVWEADSKSEQDQYSVTYNELDSSNKDTSTVFVEESHTSLENLLPGKNYSIKVKAVSNTIESLEKELQITVAGNTLVPEDLNSTLINSVQGVYENKAAEGNVPTRPFPVKNLTKVINTTLLPILL